MAISITKAGALRIKDVSDQPVERRLCAGAYLDRSFRDFLIREIYNRRFRWVAPSYGFDLIPVLRHAWWSWWGETIERLILLVTLIVVAVWFPYEGIMVPVALGLLFFSWRCVQLAPKRLKYAKRRLGLGLSEAWQVRGDKKAFRKPGVQRQRSKHFQDEREQLRSEGTLHLRGVKICAAILLIVFLLDAQRVGVDAVLWSLGKVFLLLTAAGVIGAVFQQGALWSLRRAEPRAPHRLSGRMARIQEQQFSAVAIYSGSRSFVGAGLPFRRWSIAQRLIKPKEMRGNKDEKEEWETPPFRTEEILDCLSRSIKDLRTEQDLELRLPGLTVEGRVFVKGVRAGSVLKRMSEKKPKDLLAEVLIEPGGAARHYLVCTVVSWDGDLVALVFVHVSLQGRTLYLEFVPQELRPPRDLYNVIEEPGGTGARALLSAIGNSFVEFPLRVLALWRLLVIPAYLWNAVLAWPGPVPSIRRAVDIGARTSARENATGLDHDDLSSWTDDDEDEFQTADVMRNIKIIQQRLLSTVEEFLNDHKVDTSEFRDHAMTIVKAGIISVNGSVDARGSAFGDHSDVKNRFGDGDERD